MSITIENPEEPLEFRCDCGKASRITPEDMKEPQWYCPHCGARYNINDVPETKCPNCDYSMAPGEVYCRKCGIRTKAAGASEDDINGLKGAISHHKKKMWSSLILALIVALATYFVWSSFYNDDSSNNEPLQNNFQQRNTTTNLGNRTKTASDVSDGLYEVDEDATSNSSSKLVRSPLRYPQGDKLMDHVKVVRRLNQSDILAGAGLTLAKWSTVDVIDGTTAYLSHNDVANYCLRDDYAGVIFPLPDDLSSSTDVFLYSSAIVKAMYHESYFEEAMDRLVDLWMEASIDVFNVHSLRFYGATWQFSCSEDTFVAGFEILLDG